jgi:hypothetical protein
MTLTLNHSQSIAQKIHLDQSDLLQVKRVAPGETIFCEDGIVWITQDGDNGDYILTAGETFVSKSRGMLLVEAMRDAALRLQPSIHLAKN